MKLGNTLWVFFIISVIIILLWIFRGPPDKIEIKGLTWNLENKVEQPINIIVESKKNEPEKSVDLPKDYLNIVDLKPRQKIYASDDRAYVDFIVNNPKNIWYNLTMNWYYNNSRFTGWTNRSNITQLYYSNYPTNKIGEWKVQVLLNWKWKNQSYSRDNITSFSVS